MRKALRRLLLVFLAWAAAGCATNHRGRPTVDPAGGLDPAARRAADALAFYTLGVLQEENQEVEAAIRSYTRSIEAADGPIQLPLRVAATHLARQEPTQALAVLKTARRRRPKSPELALMIGLAYQAAEQHAEAKRAFEQLIRLAPDKPDGYIRLALLLAADERPAAALRVLDQGLRRTEDPLQLVPLLQHLGRIYIVANRPADAVAALDRVVARQPEDPAMLELLARALILAGNNRRAVATLETLGRLRPLDRRVNFLLGETHEKEGRLEEALAQYEIAMDMEPPDPAPHLRAAQIALALNSDRLDSITQQAVERFPLEVGLRIYRGLAMSHMKRYPEAVAEFERAEQLLNDAEPPPPPLWPVFLFWYGAACERSGQFERAEALLQRSMEHNPEQHEALNYLAYMWADKGLHLEKAMELIERALKLVPTEGAYVDTRGWILFQMGRYREALADLRRANKLAPGDPTITEHMGDAYHALGRTRAAMRWWRRSLAIQPDNSAVMEKIRSAQQPPKAAPIQKVAPAAP